jgi:hypothetical protein
MKMTSERQDFLINEYSNLNAYVSSAWALSYTVLAGGIGLFGFLVTQVQENVAAAPKATLYAFMLTLVPTILSLVLGQITSGVYFFYFRMLEIAQEFEVNDVWHKWDDFVMKAKKKKRYTWIGIPRYAASFPLAVVSYIGTIFTPFYLFILQFPQFPWSVFPWSVSFFFAVLMTPVNVWLTYKRLVPHSFYQRIEDDFGFRIDRDSDGPDSESMGN